MPADIKLPALPPLLLTLLSLTSLLLLPQLCDAHMKLSFDACCSVGINSTHRMDLEELLRDSGPEECVAIGYADKIFKEVTSAYAS